MIEALLKVIDKSIELIKLRQKNDKEFFDLVILPLFIEFEGVAQKYFELANCLDATRDELDEIRKQYLQSRIKVSELVKVYDERTNDIIVSEFFKAIHEFFFGDVVATRNLGGSAGLQFINLATGKKKHVRPPQTAKKIQDDFKGKLEFRWGEVVRIYGELQMRYGLPVGYKA